MIGSRKKSALLTATGALTLAFLVNLQPIRAQEGGDALPPYCEGGLPDGFVKCVYTLGDRDGDRYEGEFVNGS